jgi:hypothetical protein
MKKRKLNYNRTTTNFRLWRTESAIGVVISELQSSRKCFWSVLIEDGIKIERNLYSIVEREILEGSKMEVVCTKTNWKWPSNQWLSIGSDSSSQKYLVGFRIGWIILLTWSPRLPSWIIVEYLDKNIQNGQW